MKAQDLVNLIAIRDFTYRSIDNISIKMSREEVKALQSKLTVLDQKIVSGIAELNFSSFEDVPKKKNENTK